MDEQIYDGFASNDDNRLMDQFHELEWPQRTPLVGQLADERLRSLGQRLVYVEVPNQLEEVERRDYDVAIARRLMAEPGTVPWLTLPQAIVETGDMLAIANDTETVQLTELRQYLVERAEAAEALLA